MSILCDGFDKGQLNDIDSVGAPLCNGEAISQVEAAADIGGSRDDSGEVAASIIFKRINHKADGACIVECRVGQFER